MGGVAICNFGSHIGSHMLTKMKKKKKNVKTLKLNLQKEKKWPEDMVVM